MDYLHLSGFLLFEWIRTFFIFTIIDRILIKKKFKDSFKSHETYIFSLIVAGFFLTARSRDRSIISFLFWGLITVIIYTQIKHLYFKYVIKK